MLKKPDSCKGCPLYQEGFGWVPDELVPNATVFVLGQNPGAEEEAAGKPFVGRTGEQLDTQFLPLAGLERGKNVSVGNILKCRWAGDNALPDGPLLSEAVLHCTQTHLQIPASTRLVVSQGALGFKYVSQGRYYRADGRPATVSDYRGFILPTKLVVDDEGKVINETWGETR